jgi:hypothetical protein
LRTPQNVAVAQFITNLGGAMGLTMITVVIVVVMTVRWRSRTPLLLLAIGTAGSLLMTAVGKELVGRARPPVADAVPESPPTGAAVPPQDRGRSDQGGRAAPRGGSDQRGEKGSVGLLQAESRVGRCAGRCAAEQHQPAV